MHKGQTDPETVVRKAYIKQLKQLDPSEPARAELNETALVKGQNLLSARSAALQF